MNLNDAAHHCVLVTGKLPEPWRGERAWIDLVPGAEIEAPGGILRCFMDRQENAFCLRLEYQEHDATHAVVAELGGPIDMSMAAGFPFVVIPRALRPCDAEHPAAVMLEFASLELAP